MNELRQLYRPLLPLAAATAVLLSVWMLLLNGVGAAVQWPDMPARAQDPLAQAPAEAVTPVAPPQLQEYQQVWLTPLFQANRQPDAANAAAGAFDVAPLLDSVVLTGIVAAQQVRVALLKENTGQALSLKEGQTLPNGWLLERIGERHIELVNGPTRQTLELSTPRLPMTLP